MNDEDFNLLLESVRQAGKTKRGEKTPNKETLQAMRDGETGSGKHVKSADELFDDILGNQDK